MQQLLPLSLPCQLIKFTIVCSTFAYVTAVMMSTATVVARVHNTVV